ncbi:oxidoreductase [Sphingomonas sp. SRS2]|uniref:oxidoreductase n=1 Tax=Sphingomonas sp. SRS2 TaxID=133190 RepID=UPI001F22F8F8|nr:oxidoreductase [Sphingomonas sp. SRS2]
MAEQVLRAGYRVVATARRQADVDDLAAQHPDRVLPLRLDITDPTQIVAAVGAAEARFGAIDVLVNNAGYIYLGAVEEGDEQDVRTLFETNLFGPISLIKAVLPAMRARKSGHIVNISSIGGLITFPGSGYYNMVKSGVEALSDVLAKEVGPLGIHVTVVAPGAFRTSFRAPGSLQLAPVEIEDYAETAGAVRTRIQNGHGAQAGDPDRGAKAIIAAVEANEPPVHLLIGGDALDLFREKLDAMKAETDAWETLTRSTDFTSA